MPLAGDLNLDDLWAVEPAVPHSAYAECRQAGGPAVNNPASGALPLHCSLGIDRGGWVPGCVPGMERSGGFAPIALSNQALFGSKFLAASFSSAVILLRMYLTAFP